MPDATDVGPDAGEALPTGVFHLDNCIVARLVFLMGVPVLYGFKARPARYGSRSLRGGGRVARPLDLRYSGAVGIGQGRCSPCHAADPIWEGMPWPPSEVPETRAPISLHSGKSFAMSRDTLNNMAPDERFANMRGSEACQ